MIIGETLLEKCPWGRFLRNFITWINSQPFPCYCYLFLLFADHRKRRAFWAETVPFVDTGHFIIIHRNYREPGRSQVREPFLPTVTTGFSVVSADDDKTACVNKGCRVSSKSPLLARAGEDEGARKRTRLASSFPNAGKSFLAWKRYAYYICLHPAHLFSPANYYFVLNWRYHTT